MTILEDDDKKPRISWRGDGQFFVVSSVTDKGYHDVLDIYVYSTSFTACFVR